MFRFFVDKKDRNYFILNKNVLKHIKAARVQEEEFVCVYNEKFYRCSLENEKALIIEEIEKNHEFSNEVILAASIINTKRFEWLIQKATELGATKLIPVFSTNVSQKLGKDVSKKVERWNQIALSAAEQSFRNKQTIVTDPMNFDEVILIDIKNKFIAHEKETKKSFELFPQKTIFLVGPEGGFTDDEILKAAKNGFEVISLGKRILRAETASLFLLSRVK